MNSKLFEKIYYECRLKPLLEQIYREAKNSIDVSKLPVVPIEINAAENKYFYEIKNSKTEEEKELAIKISNLIIKVFFRNILKISLSLMIHQELE